MNPSNIPFSQAFSDLLQSGITACRVRYAPTPSGYLHIGNALNFWYNHQLARKNGGSILLRIDDLDAERKRPEYVADIFQSLKWLGLDWDEGPKSAADFEANWSQHLRLKKSEELLTALRDAHLVFACAKSRRDLAPYQGKYPSEFRNQGLSLDQENVAWRIKTPEQFPVPDFIVRRRDGLPAYQISSLADDLHFGISHIIRGADLEPSTQAQRFIAQQLGLQAFLNIQFLHHPLILNEQGEKLSKSAGSTSLKSMQESGHDAASILKQFTNNT